MIRDAVNGLMKFSCGRTVLWEAVRTCCCSDGVLNCVLLVYSSRRTPKAASMPPRSFFLVRNLFVAIVDPS